MHGTEHCNQERRTPRLSAPRSPFSPVTGSTLPGPPRPLLLSRSEPVARNGLSLARNGCLSPDHHSGVDVPGLLLRSLPAASAARSALWLRCRRRFAPATAASMPQARCGLHCRLAKLLPRPPLPFGTFTSLRIKVFNRFRRPSVRLPDPPDLLSLPATRSIASSGCGSTFLVRFVSGGWLFLKPLGTFPNMLPKPFAVNAFLRWNRTFPQIVFAYVRRS